MILRKDVTHEKFRVEYSKECDICTMKMIVLGQKDNSPEYYSEIAIQCHCGNWLEFEIPVN